MLLANDIIEPSPTGAEEVSNPAALGLILLIYQRGAGQESL